jgi:hypothetical protein
MFTSLTHFHLFGDIHFFSCGTSAHLPSFLAQLPVLTHFGMYFNPSTGGDILATAQNMLITCPALRVLILTPTMTRYRDIGSVPSIDDNRFVHMKTLLVDYRNSWLAHPQGRDGLLSTCRRICGEEETTRRNPAKSVYFTSPVFQILTHGISAVCPQIHHSRQHSALY